MKKKALKKNLLLVAIIAMLCFVTIMSVSAEIIYRDSKGYILTEDKRFSYEIVDGEAVIRGYYGSESDVLFPTAINGFPVTRIGEGACGDNKIITSIVISDTIISIENDAFYGCENLEHIKLSDNVEYMGYWVFRGTKWYNQFDAGDLIYIDKVLYEFKMVSGYKPVQPEVLVIKDGTKCIAGDALRGLSETREITIPDSVISIGQSAFNEIEKLKTLNLGSGIKYVSK